MMKEKRFNHNKKTKIGVLRVKKKDVHQDGMNKH